MMRTIKRYVRRAFPGTLILKARLVAWRDSISSVRESYSQTGEDKMIEKLLEKEGITSRFYIDVGANHPTKLSNTYRMYRKGYSGMTIEPNQSLLRLHRKFRKRDVQLAIGCGDEPALLKFQHATSHVLSGFQNDDLKTSDFRGTEFVPVLPLDLVTAGLDVEEITVLSIDVEGYDTHVVRGARETLRKTRVVVIEADAGEGEMLPLFEAAGFVVAERTKHNLILLRK